MLYGARRTAHTAGKNSKSPLAHYRSRIPKGPHLHKPFQMQSVFSVWNGLRPRVKLRSRPLGVLHNGLAHRNGQSARYLVGVLQPPTTFTNLK
jgi:hypothetical protein